MKIEKLAAKVANDISEGIDNGESRKKLRQVISWWANQYSEASYTLAAYQHQDEVISHAYLVSPQLGDNMRRALKGY